MGERQPARVASGPWDSQRNLRPTNYPRHTGARPCWEPAMSPGRNPPQPGDIYRSWVGTAPDGGFSRVASGDESLELAHEVNHLVFARRGPARPEVGHAGRH